MPLRRPCYLCGFSHSEKISTFQFPNVEATRKIWADFCSMPADSLENHRKYYLCIRHFAQDALNPRPSTCTRPSLKKNAVPSIRVSDDTGCTGSVNKSTKKKDSFVCNRRCYLCGLDYSQKLSTFQFPNVEATRKIWADFCSLPTISFENRRNYYLCFRHFAQDAFNPRPHSTCTRLSLKKNAVPSIRVSDEASCSNSNKTENVEKKHVACFICGRPTDMVKKSYHRFPKHPPIRKKWVEYCKSQGSYGDTERKCLLLCSKHFTEDSFMVGLGIPNMNSRRLLKCCAIPTVCDPSSHVQDEEMPVCRISTIGKNIEDPTDNSPNMFVNQSVTLSEALPGSPTTAVTLPDYDVYACPSTPKMPEKLRVKRLRYIRDFSNSDLITPRRAIQLLTMAKKMNDRYTTKICALRQKLRAANKKIERLSDFIDKNLSVSNSCDIIVLSN